MVKKPSPAFQWYPADFLRDTALMSPAESGMYAKALCHLWSHENLPVSPERLCRVLGTSPDEVRQCWSAIEKLMVINGEVFTSESIDTARQRQDDFREIQSRKGLASAEARRNRGSTAVQPEHQPNFNSSSSSSPTSLSSPASSTAPPPSASGPATDKAPRRKASGAHAGFIDFFKTSYERHLGTAYIVTAADGVATATLLKSFTPEVLQERAYRWLVSTDPWVSGTDRALKLFASKVNMPELRGAVNGHGPPTQLDQNLAVLARAASRGIANGNP